MSKLKLKATALCMSTAFVLSLSAPPSALAHNGATGIVKDRMGKFEASERQPNESSRRSRGVTLRWSSRKPSSFSHGHVKCRATSQKTAISLHLRQKLRYGVNGMTL